MVLGFIKRTARGAFRGIKKTGRKVFRTARKVASAVSKPLDVVNEGVKKMLNKVKSVPILGDIAKRGISVARGHPVFGAVIRAIEGTSAGVDALEAFGKGNDAEAKRNLRKVAAAKGGNVAQQINKIVDRL